MERLNMVGRWIASRDLPGETPTNMQVYQTKTVDPMWQRHFTIMWTSILAFTTVASLPWVYRAARRGRLYAGLAIRESLDSTPSEKGKGIQRQASPRSILPGQLQVWGAWQKLTLPTLPLPTLPFGNQVADCCRRSYFSLSIGQWVLVLAYIIAAVCSFTVGTDFKQNANRPGYIAVAQLPVLILMSLKSPLPIPVFVPSLSYEHYNFLHRWVGRTIWLAVTVHMSIYITQWRQAGETSQIWQSKSIRGYIAYAMMCMVVLTSLKPLRRKFYQVFWAAHVTFFVGFFAAVCYHTKSARPWIYPCVALYAYDQFIRLLRYRVKDAIIVPVDPTMTMIHIPDCDSGWLATQHVFLRVLRGPGIFESHPFTIVNAPPGSFNSPRGITLYAKVAGDWTKRLHAMASDTSLEVGDDYEEREAFIKEAEKPGADHPGRKVTVVLDGPYGGLKMDLGEYANVLLVAGGSGVTFLLGSIEEALCCHQRGSTPSLVEAVWVVRDLSTIEALAPTLARLHALATRSGMELQYNLYLTDPPVPLPPIPAPLPHSTTLSPFRPEVAQLVREALPSSGGLAVVAAGPEGLVMEARNAVASIGISQSAEAGGVGFHDEVYSL